MSSLIGEGRGRGIRKAILLLTGLFACFVMATFLLTAPASAVGEKT